MSGQFTKSRADGSLGLEHHQTDGDERFVSGIDTRQSVSAMVLRLVVLHQRILRLYKSLLDLLLYSYALHTADHHAITLSDWVFRVYKDTTTRSSR